MNLWSAPSLAGGMPRTRLFILFPLTNMVVGCLQMVKLSWPIYFGGG